MGLQLARFLSAHVENVTICARCCIIGTARVPEACVTWSPRRNAQMGSMMPCAALSLDCTAPTGSIFGKRKSAFRLEQKRDRNSWEREIIFPVRSSCFKKPSSHSQYFNDTSHCQSSKSYSGDVPLLSDHTVVRNRIYINHCCIAPFEEKSHR